ncbi:four helix bundle protein [Stieleria sp. ICT_E10.1]|uniref:four helix bundle protein n=1 Tax=Stieleria sedimenti TaxID=2976331 RepID=UPI00218065E4|nr:four helix bundle protein [Stieleria sedimenti]MCS7471624.1 four helix bundle protein [Stieleria sedimenti]
MTDTIFDHDRLDVYRLAIEYTADSFSLAKDLTGLRRHARDQWLRASQSIPLNIAEGNGKRSAKDRGRYLEIARGSALECAAIQDVLTATGGLDAATGRELKLKLKRIVSMLTRMVMKTDTVSEAPARYDADIDYDDEHRFAEHEHEWRAEPEPSRAPEPGLRPSSNGKSNFPAR